MSGSIIPFESSALPAHLMNAFPIEKLGVEGIGGFPHVSIKGKVFHIIRAGESQLVTRPGEGDPAGSIDVVIIKQNPNRSKVYYTGGYVEGSDAKPTCSSNDGIAPDAGVAQPQAAKCAVCPHNQWGSRITENGAKTKACSDSQRIAIAPLGLINDPMLLRIPAASLKALDSYGQQLQKRQVPYQMVVTKIGFDYSVAHPALTFKPVGFIDEATAAEVLQVMNEPVVAQIIGTVAAPVEVPEQTAAPVQQVVQAPVAPPVQQTYVAPTPPVQQPVQQVTQPTVAFPSFSAPEVAPAPVAPPVQQAVPVQPATVVVSSELSAEIGSMLDSLNFDDAAK